MSRASGNWRIERVIDQLPLGFDALCHAAEAEGHRFLTAFGARFKAGAERFDRDPALYVALFIGNDLVGTGGIGEDPYVTEDGLGRLRHLYVAPAHRRSGAGGRIVTYLLAHARGRYTRLRLRTDNPSAARLYERSGFLPVTEPQATHALTLPPRRVPTPATV